MSTPPDTPHPTFSRIQSDGVRHEILPTQVVVSFTKKARKAYLQAKAAQALQEARSHDSEADPQPDVNEKEG